MVASKFTMQIQLLIVQTEKAPWGLMSDFVQWLIKEGLSRGYREIYARRRGEGWGSECNITFELIASVLATRVLLAEEKEGN